MGLRTLKSLGELRQRLLDLREAFVSVSRVKKFGGDIPSFLPVNSGVGRCDLEHPKSMQRNIGNIKANNLDSVEDPSGSSLRHWQ